MSDLSPLLSPHFSSSGVSAASKNSSSSSSSPTPLSPTSSPSPPSSPPPKHPQFPPTHQPNPTTSQTSPSSPSRDPSHSTNSTASSPFVLQTRRNHCQGGFTRVKNTARCSGFARSSRVDRIHLETCPSFSLECGIPVPFYTKIA